MAAIDLTPYSDEELQQLILDIRGELQLRNERGAILGQLERLAKMVTKEEATAAVDRADRDRDRDRNTPEPPTPPRNGKKKS